MITDKDRELLEEIKKDPDAFENLKAKARWEAMTLFGVLKDYGDPRQWGR